jgi:tetratricopeptide (TPR) repeat protein
MSQVELQRVFEEYAKRQGTTRRASLVYMGVVVGVTIACVVVIGNRVHTAEEEVQSLRTERDALQTSLSTEIDSLRTQRDALNSEIDEKTAAVKVLNDEVNRQNEKIGGLAATVEQGQGNAKATLERVRGELADAGSTPVETAQAAWSKGYAAYNAGQNDEAQRYYLQALKLDPNYAPASNSLGRIALASNDLVTAEKDFRDAIAKQPDYVPAIDNLARIELKKGHLDEAQRLASDALRYRPTYAPTEQLLKEIQAKAAKAAKAAN